MVGLKRPRKHVNAEQRTNPLMTPAQRIIQRQWLQPALPQVPPTVSLPQGTEIALVPVAKRPRNNPGTRSETVVVASGNGGLATGGQKSSRGIANVRICTVVPPLISPMSSIHDDDQQPPEVLATSAQVHVSAEPIREQAGGSESPGEAAIATIGNINGGDNDAEVFSQEDHRTMIALMLKWKKSNCEGLTAVDRDLAMAQHELETLHERIREVETVKAGLQRKRARLLAQQESIKTIAN